MNSSLLAVVDAADEERAALVRRLEALGYRVAGTASSLPAIEPLAASVRPEFVPCLFGQDGNKQSFRGSFDEDYSSCKKQL